MADSTTEQTQLKIHTCDIYTLNGKYQPSNLFTHPFFYMQNGISDEKIRNYTKCFLYLHTLRYNFNEINKLSTCFNTKIAKGGFETLPLGYLYFLGGLVWRKNCSIDPIIYVENQCKYQKPKSKNDSFLYFTKNENLVGFRVVEGEGTDVTTEPYTTFIKFTNQILIENELEKLFKDFADSQFKEILNSCELKKEVNSKPENMTGTDIKKITNALIGKSNSESTNLLKGSGPINNITVLNFNNNYVLGFVEYNKLYSYFSENNSINRVFSNIFATECLVATLPSKKNKSIQKKVLINYLNGMSTVFENYEKLNQQQQTVERDIVKDTEDVRDFKCEIYLTLKNIWDRWLCGYYNNNGEVGLDIFNVENFFDKNFIFIDSFYNNIYDMLKLNCSKLEAQYSGKTNNQTKLGVSVVSHLGSVASDHMSMLFNFPDNVNFAEIDRKTGKNKRVNMIQNMKEVFTPIPSNMVTEPEYSNKFTLIYTHSANKLDTVDRNKFNHDSFDIWSFNEGTDIAPAVFKGSPSELDSDAVDSLTNGSRIAYKVPAFGVAYSRQNNSLWKNIQITMDNFSVTEQAVRAEAYIANKGNSEKHNITYYGQDIYSLYQAYSYLVTIEMMGDAQIQPLMYFQLMNVPMFRGTYMIIRVEHKITPGNMTTTFTGMKMSKVQAPYAKNWITKSSQNYVIKPPQANMDVGPDAKDTLVDSNGSAVNIKDDKFEQAVKDNLSQTVAYCDDFVKNVYKSYTKKAGIKIPLEGDLTANSTQNMLTWLKDSKGVWNVYEFPNAIHRNYNVMISGANRPKVGDLLFGYHDDKLSGKHDHVAIYLGVHGGKHYVAEGKSRSGKIINEENTTNPGIPQVVDMEVSRLSLNSDYITHFATCNKVAQTDASNNYIGTVIAENSGEISKYVVDDEGNITPFTFEFIYNGKSLTFTSYADTEILKNKQENLSNEVKNSLRNLVTNILKPLNVVVETKDGYNYIGHLHITSGYRCPEVNDKIPGHSDISQHMEGEAADFQILGGNMYEENKQIIKTIIQWMQNESINLKFGQLIIYNKKDGAGKDLEYVIQHPQYMHISIGNKCEIKWNNGVLKDTTAQEVMAIING